MDLFKGLFGIPFHSRSGFGRNNEGDNRNDNDPNYDHRSHQPFQSFSVFTNPLEMEKFFDEQFDQLLRQFISPSFGHHLPPPSHNPHDNNPEYFSEEDGQGIIPFGNQFSFSFPFSGHNIPRKEERVKEGDREFMLKDGYETRIENGKKEDQDIDSQMNESNWKNKILPALPRVDSNEALEQQRNEHPFGYANRGNNFFFSQSFSQRTIRHPDGSIEHETTTRNNNGEEIIEQRRTNSSGETETIRTVRRPDGTTENENDFHQTSKELTDHSDNDHMLFTDGRNPIFRSLIDKFFGRP